MLETLYLSVHHVDVDIGIFTLFLASTAPTGATEAEMVPFFNVKELTITIPPDVFIEGAEALFTNGFPRLETLYLAGIIQHKVEAIFTGTALPTQALSWCDTDIDQVPTEAVQD